MIMRPGESYIMILISMYMSLFMGDNVSLYFSKIEKRNNINANYQKYKDTWGLFMTTLWEKRFFMLLTRC